MPRIRLLPGERTRDFVLSYELEDDYLEEAPQPLRDLTLLALQTGLRLGEILRLPWPHVKLEPVNGARFGYPQVVSGKSRNACRNVPLTDRASAMLRTWCLERSSPWVFGNEDGNPYLVTSINHIHSRVRSLLRLPKDFVIRSLRHTMLTRLGESGVDAFTIMRIAGHSSITVSQRYIHPSPEAVERAFERLQSNTAALLLTEERKRLAPATVSATLAQPSSVSH